MKFFTKILCISLLFLCGGCNLDIKPEDEFSDPDAISNVVTARELLGSIYNSFPKYNYELSLLSDDFVPTNLIDKDVNLKSLYLWQDKYISDLSVSMWEEYYFTVSLCNILIERLPNVITLTDSEKRELECITAEVKTVKAMCYFHLLQLFSPSFKEGKNEDGILLKDKFGLFFHKRSSIEECVNEIRNLLLQAKEVNNSPLKSGWHSKVSALVLLSDLELYSKNYNKCIEYTEEAFNYIDINSVNELSYNNLWSIETSKERIFSQYISTPFYKDLQYSEKDGDYFILNKSGNYVDSDVRRKIIQMEVEYTNDKGEILKLKAFGKYNLMNKNAKEIRYINRISVANLFFNSAEALIRAGKEKDGIIKLNTFLAKRGSEEIDENVSGSILLERFLNEREKEFVGEGDNYFYLKRERPLVLKRYSAFGKSVSTSVKSNDYRWTFPIPKSEYKYNENVKQNEGWTKEN